MGGVCQSSRDFLYNFSLNLYRTYKQMSLENFVIMIMIFLSKMLPLT